MTRFRYRAIDQAGKTCRGSLEAAGFSDARARLRQMGLLAVSVREARFFSALGDLQIRPGPKRPSAAEISVFTRQMATLIASGVQIEAALAAIAGQTTPRISALCRATRAEILNGGSLSKALGQQHNRFDRFYLTSLRSGEQSGRLGAVLDHLADHMETAQRHRQTVLLALIYPAILVAVSVAVILALLVYVLPDIVRVFAARGADLPPLTKAMISISDFVSSYGVLMLLAVAILMAGLLALSRNAAVRVILHQVLWRVGLVRQVVLVQFTGTLSTLTQSGVALTDALKAATTTVGNLQARACLTQVANEVQEGMSLSRALAAHPEFPPMMITIVASGETSGRLPTMLGRFWTDQSQSLQARIKAMVGLVEPLVLLGMGGIVMLLVLAILLPIVSLNTLVG